MDLSNADFSGARLDTVYFYGTTLTGADFSGASLDNVFFAPSLNYDTTLTGANFSGASLDNVGFLSVDLTGANFSNATSNATSPGESVAFYTSTLTKACFIGAQLPGMVMTSDNTLTCADFSHTNLANAHFPSSVKIDTTQPCRTAFRNVTMPCAFVAQWGALDLTGAVLTACHTELQGLDLSGARMAQAVLDGNDLTGTTWHGAVLTGASFQGATLDNATGLAATTAQPSDLSGAKFNNASLKGVDLSNTLLYGANFTYANLENASLRGAFLTNNPKANPPGDAAKFGGAHLKNVNLSGAQLDSVNFSYASFYGSFNGLAPVSTAPCETDTSKCPTTTTGFTCSCATARGATMVRTIFSNAYLYGVDFGGSTTTINGVDFSGAILVGANFADATFAVDPSQGGAPPVFSNAYLQGVQFGTEANLTNTSLSGAFVDFGAATNPSNGNIMQILLGTDYTLFNGWEAPDQPVCVQAVYGPTGCSSSNTCYTVVPTTIPTMTCPDGNTSPEGCGPTQASNTRWKSPSPIGQATPPGWYLLDATYTQADPNNACNPNPNW
jgi:uncharacterized protein YjbI with pentapeptide repeats